MFLCNFIFLEITKNMDHEKKNHSEEMKQLYHPLVFQAGAPPHHGKFYSFVLLEIFTNPQHGTNLIKIIK